jgi:response regulator RpfG family c-di-GMP phosphodiesterase
MIAMSTPLLAGNYRTTPGVAEGRRPLTLRAGRSGYGAERLHMRVLEHLVFAVEAGAAEPEGHTEGVARASALIARTLGMSTVFVRRIQHAARFHDIGKIAVPAHILRKCGELSADERRVIRSHSLVGAQILRQGRSAVLRMAAQIALRHHEHWDGNGYPYGIRGYNIPLAARIVAVADVFDALVRQRAYKDAWPVARAVAEIRFDPRIVDAFVRIAGSI